MRLVIFTVMCVHLFSISNAQNFPVDKETSKISYTEVVGIQGVSKAELYARGATWFAKTYGSSKAVLEISDKEDGKLMGKALTEVSFKNPPLGTRYGGLVNYTITVQVKDDKYKYTITDLSHISGTDNLIAPGGALENEKKPKGTTMRGLTGQGGFPSQKQWEQIRENADQNIVALIASLKKGMAKGDSDF